MSRPPLAVIGMGCRLPGASTPDELWTALENGRDPFAAGLPADRFNVDAYRDEPAFAESPPRAAALLDDFEIDWRRLRLPPVQVERMHRMDRVALDTMARALADAGLHDEEDRKRTRVFVGAGTLGADPLTDAAPRIRRHEFTAPLEEALAELLPDDAGELAEQVERTLDAELPPIESDSMINSASIAAGRIANVFDLTGGHVAVDAGAVSGLAALDQASAALAAGACEYAVVAAVSPLVGSHPLLAFAQRGMLASDRPRPFAEGSDGTLLGEGCVALVLTRLDTSAATRPYAVIEGIGSGLASNESPGTGSHVVRAAERVLSRVGADPSTVLAVESCASGVASLDTAEATGLARVYGSRPVTSSVPHVGYLYGAAGLVALLKAALALRRGRWPGADVGALPRDAPRRAAVSDAGPGPLAYHVLVTAPGEAEPHRPVHKAPAPGDRRLAIVGMGAIAARAPDGDAFWRNVVSGADAIGDLPDSRWDVDRLMGPDAQHVLRTRLAATIDAPGFSPDAGPDDPAERLALAVAGEALRDAGHEPGRWDPARVAVIFGQLSMRSLEAATRRSLLLAEHLAIARGALARHGVACAHIDRVLGRAMQRFDGRPARLERAALASLTGVDCAARVAAAHGFDGSALCVDAACASSLAAVESAAHALWLGEVDAAVAGGVAFNLIPEYYIALSALGALSPDGVPPFHVGSDGFVPGEGAGCVVLRRLEDALAAGERVYAVISGIGTSSDGRGASVYAPNPAGERRAVENALTAAGNAPGDIDFVEAHGTGTKLGDGIELDTYATVFGGRDPRRPVGLGAVKSQIGHLSSAGGALALIKVARALHDRTIPPSARNGRPRPELADGSLPLRFESRPRHWPASQDRPRRAGVSSFGIGGANVHVILEETEATQNEREPGAPAGDLTAGRFVPELVPLSLARRPPRVSLHGRHFLVDVDADGCWRAVADRLHAAGANVSTLDGVATDALDAAIGAAEAEFGLVRGVVDLTTFGSPADAAAPEAALFADRARRHSARAFGLLRRVYDGFERDREGRPVYAAVTSLGGDLGLSGGGSGDVLGASLAGAAKGLKQELPWVEAKVIDFRPDDAPTGVAETLVRELESGSPELEIAYAERRYVVRMRSRPLGAPTGSVGRGDVVLLTGGGRGVVFECARALAALGARVVVCGRTEIGGPQDWAQLDDEAFERFRHDELERRRAADPRLTPAAFARDFEGMARRREIHRNLELAERFGTPVSYEPCDVTDPASVARLVERVRSKHGRLDGVVHGAMVEQSTILPRKSPELIERTIATKVVGLLNLIDATRGDKLSLLACFGSAAGRFGSEGQIDYSAANALMAATLAAESRRSLTRTRCVTIDWTAWEGVGAAVANPEITALLRATGVTWVRPEEGTFWFLSELLRGSAREVVVMNEGMLHNLPFLGSKARESPPREDPPDEFDDRGLPLLPGRWPLVDRLTARRGHEILLERTLDANSDHFIREHLLHDTPILPGTFGVELLAEAAEASCPGFRVVDVADFEIDHPVKLHRNAPFTVRAAARVVGDAGNVRVVEAETRSDLTLGERRLASDRLHHRARIRLERDAGPRAPKTVAIPDPTGPAHARSAFHLARHPVGLGPLFSRARWVQVLEDQVVGSVDPYRPEQVTARTSLPVFRVDPLLLDCAFQVASNWDGYIRGLASVPMGVASISIGRLRATEEKARVHARVTSVADPDVRYDVVVCGEDGTMLLEVRDLHLRRVGPIGARTQDTAAAHP